MIKEFVIPLNTDELLTSHNGFYSVEEILPIRAVPQGLDATKSALQSVGAAFILKHFDVFFSIIVHGNKMEIQVIMRGFTRLMKAIEILVTDMEKIYDKGGDIDSMEKLKFLNINKMLAYLFTLFISHIDDRVQNQNTVDIANIGKRKKAAKTDLEEEWSSNRQKALELIYRWLQLPLQNLWQPPIVEEIFVSIFTNMCYKILEKCSDPREIHIKQTIFEILGTLVKTYKHGLACAIRIVQLVKLHDVMAAPMAAGVIRMETECGCTGLVKEVVKEISQSELGETDSRNVSIFLESLAAGQPDLMLPLLNDITEYLECEYYVMRNCVIGVLGTVIEKSLTAENLPEERKELRDECLDNLENHILDINAYVRSKVLQTWQHLCCEGAIPLARQGTLLSSTILRLEDKSANVRKQALQLLRALLQSNPFAGKLNRTELSKSLEKEKTKLKELQALVASESARGDKERLELWNELLPEIRKAIKRIINKMDKDEGEDVDEDEDEDEEEKAKEKKKKEMKERDLVDKGKEEVDPSIAFEKIRQLMLSEEVFEAVTYFWDVCTKLKDAPDMTDLSSERKEECIFLSLSKIFMESENTMPSTETNQSQVTSEDSSNEKIKQKMEMKKLKRVVNYLKDCLEFAIGLENAVPVVENLLYSITASDAIEACTFLGTAYQFGVAGAENAIRKALFQICHRDQSVRNNAASVYKELYLSDNQNEKSTRQRALTCTKHLAELLMELQPGQSPALSQLIVTWYSNGEINSETLQVLWEKFSMKSSETVLESRTALMLLTMIASTEGGIIKDNFEVLIKIGLASGEKTDLLLARDTCRALLKIKHSSDINKPPIRYPNDHTIFTNIMTLLTDNFNSMDKNGYISFATDAVNVIYHLADQPDQLMKQLLLHITNKCSVDKPSRIPFFLLSKFLYLIGHIAIKQMVHLDISVYNELKRRNALREMKKEKKGTNRNKADNRLSRNSSRDSSVLNSVAETLHNRESHPGQEDNGEEALQGAMDDTDAEFINTVLENEIVTGNGMLVKFVPLVLDVCTYPEKYKNENVQAAGTMALSKIMSVSSTFCAEHLQLLVTILERSPYPGIRANVLYALSDLAIRFPNEVEPWMKHIYGRLHDNNKNVRSTCVRALSNLILREMVRIKGQISELALCVVDEDPEIRQMTKQLFHELSHKGNALYNVMPDILSRLADPGLELDEKKFQEIIKFILGLIQKEKQIDTIIEKICARFKLAVTERQWCDLSYCLSLLQFNAKSIRCLIESLPLLKDKIHHKQVLKTLQGIIEQTKKKPAAKVICTELEEKINNLLQGYDISEMTDSQVMPPPPVPSSKKKLRKSTNNNTEEDNSDIEEETHLTTTSRGKKVKRKAETTVYSGLSLESDSETGTRSLRALRRSRSTQKSLSPKTPVSTRPKRQRISIKRGEL